MEKNITMQTAAYRSERKTAERSITLRAIFLEASHWIGFCTYMSFMVTTLIDYGWSNGAAAGIMTAMSVIILITQPFFGMIGDKFLSEKKLCVILLLASAICFGLLPLSLGSGSVALVIANLIGITVTGQQVGGLMDAWIVGLKQEYPNLNYGLIRGSGSMAYALSAQVMGTVTVALGHGARFWLGAGFALLAAVAALSLRSARKAAGSGSAEESTDSINMRESFGLLFTSHKYVLLLVVSFFLTFSSASMMTLLQIVMREFGGTTAQIGTASAVQAVSEVPCMFAMALVMRKISKKNLFVFAGCAFVVRMFITASVTSPDALIGVQALQGLTQAVLLPVTMSYLAEIVDRRVRSTAVTFYTAITSSLTGILGNLLTTALLSAGLTAQSILALFVIPAAIGCIIAVFGVVRKIW